MAARTNSSWAPRGPRSRSRPSFRMRLRCANRISIFLRSRRDSSKASVSASERATSRACSWMSRGILRDGSFGQHCGLSGHTSQSSFQLDISGDGSLSDVMIGDDVARADDHSGCAFWHSTIVRAPPLRHAAPTSGTSLDQSGICKFIISPSAIMFSFKLAMITRDPERTRNTMSTPNASAQDIVGAVRSRVMERENTKCAPI